MPVVGEVRIAKFHPLYGDILQVALEAAIPCGTQVKVLPIDINSYLVQDINVAIGAKLIHEGGYYVKAYYPAMVEGSILSGEDESSIRFEPWFDEEEVEYHRICFRFNRFSCPKGNVMLAREGEDKPFGFDPKAPFINLDFCSRRPEGFLPVFARVNDGSEITYLLITGEIASDESGVVISIKCVDESRVPIHLSSLKDSRI